MKKKILSFLVITLMIATTALPVLGSSATKDLFDNDDNREIPEVTVPKSKPFNFNFPLISWLFERFPWAFPIIRQLIGFD